MRRTQLPMKAIATRKHRYPGRIYRRTRKGWTSAGWWHRVRNRAVYWKDWQVTNDVEKGYLRYI